jgi:hypothetical protein
MHAPMRRSELALLLCVLLVSAGLSAALLTRGHLWGDDFAAYIMQAQSLYTGTTREFVQHNAFTIEESYYPLGPIAYPWGYPLLLAPVLALTGLKVLALKLVNTLFYLLFLAVFFALARQRFEGLAPLGLTAIFAVNLALLESHDWISSDIPFLFFSTLALLLIERPGRLPAAFGLGAVIFAATSMRTNGVLLLGALAVAHALRFWAGGEWRRNLPAILAPYIAFGALSAAQALLLPGGQETYFRHYAMLTPQLVLENAAYYLLLPAEFFKGLPLPGLFGAGLGLLFLTGALADVRRNAAYLTYSALTIGLYISWPETQGLRFLFPILPVMVLLAAQGWRFLSDRLPADRRPPARRLGAGLVGVVVGLSLFASAQFAWANLQNDRSLNGPFDPVSAQMFEFVRDHTPPDSVMIFFKPRAMRLLTDRDAFATDACADFPGGDYVVLHEKQGSNGQVADPETCPNVTLQVVFNNQRFTVYELLK